MGKTPKPLRIFVHEMYAGEPWVEALKAAGHDVLQGRLDADLILGPNCARFLPGMEKFLDSFIKGTRAVKYPRRAE